MYISKLVFAVIINLSQIFCSFHGKISESCISFFTFVRHIKEYQITVK